MYPGVVESRVAVTVPGTTALPLRKSLPSTLGVVPPAPGMAVAKVSSLASSAFAPRVTVTVAVSQTVPLGAGRQTW
ncbi:hypothetical protein D3C71_2168210 [compost metagenome]